MTERTMPIDFTKEYFSTKYAPIWCHFYAFWRTMHNSWRCAEFGHGKTEAGWWFGGYGRGVGPQNGWLERGTIWRSSRLEVKYDRGSGCVSVRCLWSQILQYTKHANKYLQKQLETIVGRSYYHIYGLYFSNVTLYVRGNIYNSNPVNPRVRYPVEP